ncbi:MAG: STAS domain-containing protein [Planctomycetota bacterium]
MAEGEARLRVDDDNGVVRVGFVDRNILDEGNILAIGDQINGLIESREKPQMLISFSNVDHLSSAALGTLITINNNVKNRGGALRLADIDPQIYEVFVITRLNKIFDIYETSDEARKAFG